ncbi:hypothetical protein [Merismopedia glauca]|uniref:Nuclear transport factor 2 family protein n=1 Tax=Merismopedia glauca CCAP 1448/3 TaxID=1296344 RepID=A0A2T1C5A8_9CYAN|nr:hypothetical protein [Merismopedia glauca]PSB03327.1 hypothetical protein C7B64_09135 [Merismopedia glauca CCAP 1448/3]
MISQPRHTSATYNLPKLVGLASVSYLLAIAFNLTSINSAQARTPQTAPAELKNILTQIDTVANRQEVEQSIQFYSPTFTNSDGLNRQKLQDGLTNLWEKYPGLKYKTELVSWDRSRNGLVAETVTTISGVQQTGGRTVKLESKLRSRQTIQGQKIVRQEILSERSQVTSGAQPPTVQFTLPEKVRVGQEYNFDAIVKEPLGDDLLLGTATEQPVKVENYFQTGKYELKDLPAGGIFKTGKAAPQPGDYWISAVFIRSGGMTTIVQRLKVVNRL